MIAGILDEREAEHIGDGLARQIVVGRPEPAGEDDQVARDDASAKTSLSTCAIVADDRLGLQLDAERAPGARR